MEAQLPGDDLILAAGALLAAGIVAVGLAQRVRAPSLLVLLAVGMVIGSDGLGWVQVGFDDLDDVQIAATAALVVILFEGGLSTPMASLRRVRAPALALATGGTVVTAAVVAGTAHLVLDIEVTTALLIGAVVSSTDAAAVFAMVRDAPVPARVRQVLQVESGINDPMAVMLTIVAIEMWRGDPTALGAAAFGIVQLGGGVAVGLLVGRAGAALLGRAGLADTSAYPVLALALAAIAYGIAAAAGGSGFLATYVAGLVIGDGVARNRRLIRSFHAGLGSVADSGLFLLLGLLVYPADVIELAPQGLAIAVVLVLVARPLAVVASMGWFRLGRPESAMVAWAGLRGAVPIVLATFALSADHPDGIAVFNVVFFVVVVSAAVQGTTIAPLARRLGLRADDDPWSPVAEVLPLDEVRGELVEVELAPDSLAAGRVLVDAQLPAGFRVVALLRPEGVVIPDGATELRAGDRVLTVSDRSDDLDLVVRWSGPSPSRR